MVARRAEPPAFAGKGQQILMLAMVATNPGEAALQVPTVQEFVDDLGNDGAQGTVTRLVSLRVNLFELVIVPAGALPER
jgi:hypothetical protein